MTETASISASAASSGVHRVAARVAISSANVAEAIGAEGTWLRRFTMLAAARYGVECAAVAQRSSALFDAIARQDIALVELHAAELCADLRVAGADSEVLRDIASTLRSSVPPGSCEHAWLACVVGVVGTMASVYRAAASESARSSERIRASAKADADPCRGLVGSSAMIRALRARLRSLADAPGTVLIVGESGTGKELVAEATHQLSGRAKHPFIPVNCAALPPELIESELFGHERGAFTGSREASVGLLRAADEGTVFLDEVTEMPVALQAKLLRVLEQRRVRPVGGLKEVPFGARVVAATNLDPVTAVREGKLRHDLFYRLCVHRLDLPPLRSWPEDVPLLIEHFVRELGRSGHPVPFGFGAAALRELGQYAFPGNVRELRNIVEHAVAVCPEGLVQPEHLPSFARSGSRQWQPGAVVGPEKNEGAAFPTLAQVESLHIRRALQLAEGNKTHAAKLLGVSRHQFYIKLQRLGIED